MIKQVFCVSGLLAAVSACGGGSAGAGAGDSVTSYEPAFATSATDTIATNASTTGVSGIVAFSDVIGGTTRLGSVKVRLSEDRSTAYVSVDSGSEKQLSLNTSSGTWYSYGAGAEYLIINADGSTVGSINYGKGTLNTMGAVGLETPIANLPPSGTARYSGLYAGHALGPDQIGASESLAGTIYMDVDFDSNDVSGALGIEPLTSIETGDLVGEIDGTLSGNGLSGDVTLTGGDYSGTISFGAKFMGYDGAEISGAAAGAATLDSDGSDRNIAVSFELE